MLLEIVDSLISITEGNRVNAMLKMKRSIRRFREAYSDDYALKGTSPRVFVKGLMIVGYVCGAQKHFPFCEGAWKQLHDYRLEQGREYHSDHPEEMGEWRDAVGESCLREIASVLTSNPIEECSDYARLLEAFDMMRHLAHLGGVWVERTDIQFDEKTLGKENWYDVNPWRLPRGKSMLIDYWYNIPLDLRPVGHMVLDALADSKTQSIEDVRKLRGEVERW